MKVNILTLCEGHYHFGVAAMVNSLARIDFKGNVSIYLKGDLPPWTRQLTPQGDGVFQIGDITLNFIPTEATRHFGYHKPFVALEEFRRHPDCEAVICVDPDIVFLAPWDFFEGWLKAGLALCLDCSFPFVSQHHPWRTAWTDLVRRGIGREPKAMEHYANSGFVGITRNNIEFLDQWVAITKTFEADGGNTETFDQEHRYKPVVGDQDLMAATLMGWDGKISFLGLEGMGFTGYNIYLSHDTGQPKPWIRPYLWHALGGVAPTPAASHYFKYANAPIAPYSAWQFSLRKTRFRLAQVISRIWSRS